jgi:hypothetical protein
MWVIVHVFSGLALGAALGGRGHEPTMSLLVLLPLALVAHAVLDLVPHWDYTRSRLRALWAVVDVGAAAALVIAAVWWDALPGWLVLVGVVSALPDLDVLDAVLPVSKNRRWFPSHWRRFPHGQCGAAWGIPIQVGVMVLAAVVLAG